MTRTRKRRSRRFSARRLFDLATGEPKALLNAGPITALRTGAAAAVGAKYLARKDAKTLTIVGCGELCPYLAAAALAAIPSLKTVYLTNPHRPEKGRRAARRRDSGNGRAAQGVRSCPYRRDQRRGRCSIRRRRKRHRFHRHLRQGAGRKERLGQARYACKLYRCRPARQAGGRIGGARPRRRLRRRYGAVLRCRRMRAAAQRGRPPALAGELGEVILGEKAGRTSDAEITVFDSTGIALQDIASAAVILKACEKQDSARSAKYKPENPRPGRIVRGEGFLQLQLFNAGLPYPRPEEKNVKMNRKMADNACGTMPDVI